MKVDSSLHNYALQVTKGPEYDILSNKQLEQLFSSNFHISNENNRMAYQLEEVLIGHKVSMLTSATLPGSVQLTPSGKLIILYERWSDYRGLPQSSAIIR